MPQALKRKSVRVKLRMDDEVIVIAGREKGKRGKIMAMDRVRQKVVVQGVNRAKRFQRRNQENPQGGVLNIEMPLHISNVAYYDSKAKRGRRLGYQNSNKTESKERVVRSQGQKQDITDRIPKNKEEKDQP